MSCTCMWYHCMLVESVVILLADNGLGRDCFVFPIALFVFLSRRGLGTRNESEIGM